MRRIVFAVALMAVSLDGADFRFEAVSMRPMEMQMGVAMNTGPSPGGYVSRCA